MAVIQTFAREAQRKLDNGDARTAAELLEEGILAYPDYTTAYVVLARAYEVLNDVESAYEVIQRGLKRSPGHRVLSLLDAELRPKALETHPTAVKALESDTAVANVVDAEFLSAEPATTQFVSDGTSQENSPTPSPSPNPSPNPSVPDDTDTLLDDGLSNVDDDNDNWPELRELVEDDAPATKTDPPAESTAQSALSSSEAEQPSRATQPASMHTNDTTIESEAGSEEEEGSEATELDTAHEAVDTKTVLQRINVVKGAVVVDQSLLKRLRLSADSAQLRLVDTSSAEGTASRTLRASNLRLVPGLEFTPLRLQTTRKQHIRSHYLPEAPAFPVIRGSDMNISPAIAPAPPTRESTKKKKTENEKKLKVEPKRTQLEELAARLERARIPVVTEEPEPGYGRSASADVSEPMVISETMAGIYEQQGLYDQAIKAYRQLARVKPEKLSYFEKKISELSTKSQ